MGAAILGGWQLSGIQQYQVGKPLQLTANNGLPIFNSTLRPDVSSGVAADGGSSGSAGESVAEQGRVLRPGELPVRQRCAFLRRVASTEFYNESFGLMRRIKLTEKATLMLRGEFFNAFNRVVFGAPVANISAANFGRVTSQANAPRQGQVAARIDF